MTTSVLDSPSSGSVVDRRTPNSNDDNGNTADRGDFPPQRIDGPHGACESAGRFCSSVLIKGEPRRVAEMVSLYIPGTRVVPASQMDDETTGCAVLGWNDREHHRLWVSLHPLGGFNSALFFQRINSSSFRRCAGDMIFVRAHTKRPIELYDYYRDGWMVERFERRDQKNKFKSHIRSRAEVREIRTAEMATWLQRFDLIVPCVDKVTREDLRRFEDETFAQWIVRLG